MSKSKFLMSLLFICAIFLCCTLFSEEVEAAGETTPYELPSGFSNKWNANKGNKDMKMETGKNIIYDVYDKKYLNDGFEIKTKTFAGKKSQKYLHFYGWAINFGYMTHTKTNHSTYIVALNEKEKKYKYYSTIPNTADVSQEVSYNIHNKRPGDIVWNQCSNSAKNKSNVECNMLYQNVGFQAYIPLEELFKDEFKAAEWKLYIVTRVNNHYVYDKLVVPFEFSKKDYAEGTVNLTSGVNAGNLQMNSFPVMKQKKIGVSNPGKYFTLGRTYKMKKANETTATSIWFQVKDGSSNFWSTSVYWTFKGQQAVIDYNVEIKPSVKINTSVSGCYYKKPAQSAKLTTTITVTDGKNKKYTSSSGTTSIKLKSSNKEVVKVDSNGKLIPLKNGSSKITVTYTDPYTDKDYKATTTVKITKCTPPPSVKACGIEISNPVVKTTMKKNTVPAVTGRIGAEGEFDVEQGIPTSEFMKTETTADSYMYEQLWQNKTGKVKYKVKTYKDYNYTWKEKDEEKTQMLRAEVEVEIERDYSYWDIGRLYVHGFDSSTLYNYAFSGGSDLLQNEEEAEDIGAAHTEEVEEHVIPADCETVILPAKTVKDKPPASGTPAKEDFKNEVDKLIGQNTVLNDAVNVGDTVVMNDEEVEKTAPKPTNLPAPKKITLENRNILLSNEKVNYYKSPSEGEGYYTNLIFEDSADDGSKPITDYFHDEDGETLDEEDIQLDYTVSFDVNPVTIHTPIIINGQTSDETAYDQRINQTPHQSKKVLILDRTFNVDFSSYGTHRDIPGYGTKDYSKYIAQKQVKFSFDVYEYNTNQFYPANTWITYSGVTSSMTYKLPIWVPEAEYGIEFKAYAINDPAGVYSLESGKNTTIPNASFTVPEANDQSAAHVVTNTQQVDVAGRVYDFKVTDVSDFNWEKVFRTGKGNEHTNNLFWIGGKDRDGVNRLDAKDGIVLPVMQGKNTTGLKNTAIKTGYNFKFDFKTMGNMYGKTDAVRITPKFYFVNKQGGNRKEVDLYYHNEDKYFTKIGSTADKVYREVTLNNALRNIEQEDLISTSDYTYRHYADFGLEQPNGYYSTFIKDFLTKESKKAVETGPYGWQMLSSNLRTLIGPEKTIVPSYSMVPAADAVRAEQNWYGEYSLPAKTYVVEKGKNISALGLSGEKINEHNPIFLKDGYIIVNFDIETIREGKVNEPYLSYYGSVNNQWKREGFNYTQTDSTGNIFRLSDGDTVLYHADKSSLDDFSTSVTH